MKIKTEFRNLSWQPVNPQLIGIRSLAAWSLKTLSFSILNELNVLTESGRWGEIFFQFPVSKIFVVPLFHPQKGIFPLFQQKNFCYKRPPHYNGYYYYFFLRAVHTFTLVYNGHFLLSPRWLKEVRQLCSIITSQKRPTRKIFPLFPMVLFLFSPRELMKRPSLGRLN